MTHTDTPAAKREPGQFQVLALTGGTGAGKGVVAQLLTDYGIPVLDTDYVCRMVYEPGQPCLAALADAFGTDILLPDGTLNRPALAARVFGEPNDAVRRKKLDTLNHIAHTYILAYCRTWLAQQREKGIPAACIDAPQLFESGFDRESDYIIGVTADKETRISRIMARDRITREAAEQRIAAQYDDAFFREHCDTILRNDGARDALIPRVEALLRARGLLA